MKAYIIKIELTDSEPLVWRRVILPAGATFYRLHQIIQHLTNFQSHYDDMPYHLYDFDLLETNQRVTNDEEAYDEHQYFLKHPLVYVKKLKTMPKDLREFELHHQEMLKIEVRKPNRMLIDDYLETYRVISYNYDFGDGWNFKINLEEIVEDYYFGYPTLLDGAETAPPEDVGGISGFSAFKKAYYNEHHVNHEDVVNWAKTNRYDEYNFEECSGDLKRLKYKKTEWDKIKHENFRILDDKYRK